MDVLRLEYDSAISDLHSINSSFDKGILRICYPGANRNKTYFSKETLERSIPTMYNCPVVAHYYREDGTLGGHDIEVITDYDNELTLVNLTQPVGVVPEGARVYFEEVEEDNGERHEYLCAEVILWKRQEAYKAIKENGVTSQSMEISVKSGYDNGDVYVVNDFEFTAFALLGECEPCFESASLQTYSVGAGFKAEFAEMMAEFRNLYNSQATSDEVDHKISKEGGCSLEEKKIEAFENAEETVDEVATEETVAEETVETVEEVAETTEEEFSLNSNLFESIIDAFGDYTINTECGELPQYCVQDYDTDVSMVYAWDATDWLLYGFSYTMNGDVVVVDFDSKKRMKFTIVEFNEGDIQNSPFAYTYEQVTEFAETANKTISYLESKYNAASEQIDAMNAELNDLRQFKSGVEAASDQAQRDELFEQFTDLNDVEEFAALVADNSEYDLSALEEKCYAIRGRNVKLNFSNKETKAPKLPVGSGEKKPDKKEPYGGLVAKYLGKTE